MPPQKPAAAFTVFLDLPVELQIMVWKQAASYEAKPRPYKFQLVIEQPQRIIFEAPPPISLHLKPDKTMVKATVGLRGLLSACWLSRDEMKKAVTDDVYVVGGVVHLNARVDLIWLDNLDYLLKIGPNYRDSLVEPDQQGRLPLLSQWRLTVQNVCVSKRALVSPMLLSGLHTFFRRIETSIPTLTRLIINDASDRAEERASIVSQQLSADDTKRERIRMVQKLDRFFSSDPFMSLLVNLQLIDWTIHDIPPERRALRAPLIGFMALTDLDFLHDCWIQRPADRRQVIEYFSHRR